MAARKAKNRYPRVGERIAPLALRNFLIEPISERLLPRNERSLRLCDLDETAWQRLPGEIVEDVSRRIVDRVAQVQSRREFREVRFPRPPDGVELADLDLETRTRRCLAQQGFEENPDLFNSRCLGEILDIPAFGPHCLVDLLCAIEAARLEDERASGLELWPQLTEEADLLAELPEAALIGGDDPRFETIVGRIDADAETLFQLAETVSNRDRDPPDPVYATEQMRLLRSLLENAGSLTIEEELIQVFGSTDNDRDRGMLVGYHGWGDGRRRTLTEVGNDFGVTRERVRQVCRKLTRRRRGNLPIFAPVMDRALELIAARTPLPADALEAEIVEEALTSIAMPLEMLLAGANLLGRSADFRIVQIDGSRFVVRSDEEAPASIIAERAKKEAYFHGLATVETIAKEISCEGTSENLAELARKALPLVRGFRWLDEQAGWFCLEEIGRHGLPKAIDKLLAVAGELSAAEVRKALSRNRRLWQNPPPENVLLEFCREQPGVRVVDDRIVCDPPRDWRDSLTGVEAILVEVLTTHGPILDRGRFEDLCIAAGVNRFSFHAFISWSPVVAQLGHSLYGLVGVKISSEELAETIARHRANQPSRRVLEDFGRTKDGKAWLSYRLSKAASTYAVVTIPSVLREVVQGSFTLLSDEGEPTGTLATRDGRAWGLGATMRRHRAKPGDRVTLTLDLEERTATVSLGEDQR